jgi:hypothetical protein
MGLPYHPSIRLVDNAWTERVSGIKFDVWTTYTKLEILSDQPGHPGL